MSERVRTLSAGDDHTVDTEHVRKRANSGAAGRLKTIQEAPSNAVRPELGNVVDTAIAETLMSTIGHSDRA